MLADWYRKQLRQEAFEKGRALERKAWELWVEEVKDWERRKAAADQAGREFSESPPAAPDEEPERKV